LFCGDVTVDTGTEMSASHFGLQDARQMKALARLARYNTKDLKI
jgi:hypothetical protein